MYYEFFNFDSHGNGGSPKSSGLKSNNEDITWVAWEVISLGIILSGTITVCMPADFAPVTPFGASSNTKHCNYQYKYLWVLWNKTWY